MQSIRMRCLLAPSVAALCCAGVEWSLRPLLVDDAVAIPSDDSDAPTAATADAAVCVRADHSPGCLSMRMSASAAGERAVSSAVVAAAGCRLLLRWGSGLGARRPAAPASGRRRSRSRHRNTSEHSKTSSKDGTQRIRHNRTHADSQTHRKASISQGLAQRRRWL